MRLVLSFLLLGIVTTPALAVDCPDGVPSCKILIITPQEEQVLIGQNGILDTAAQGRAIDLGHVVNYFRHKLAIAPAGTPKPAPGTQPAPPAPAAAPPAPGPK